MAFEIYLKGKIDSKSETGKDEKDEEKKEKEDEANKKRKRNGGDISKNGKRRKQSNDDDSQNTASEQSGKWVELESYISLLEEGPLCPINFDPKEKKPAKDEIAMPHGPDGLRYHITDIWLDELEKVISSYDSEKGEKEILVKDRLDVPIELLLRPFEKLKKESPIKSVRMKVVSEVLDDERLIEWGFRERKKRSTKSEDEDSEEDDENDSWDGFDD